MVGTDRQLAVAAVDEHGQPHGARAAEVGQGVEGGPDGAAGVQHVVDEHDDLVVDAARRDRGVHRRPGGLVAQVVAVHRDVEAPDGYLGALDLTDQVGEAVGQLDAAAGDAEQDEVVGTLVVLEDLVRDATQRPGHVARGEHGTTGRVEGMAGGHGGVGARQDADLLPCLTGQVVKGCRTAVPTLRGRRLRLGAGSRCGRQGEPRGPDRENSITQVYTSPNMA